eukprot:gnl/MRDRNA2_/MRDRNA2_29748_c0_seq2.p1 gnl/MRDRNA2_/MRDRNA2_29748_c0~~gnl/MRDRNA2_/MRDRNA2_29748_c0_seq2.p1  ORF type:complete len:232 (-),score=55.57 gnl/MRDRNA2_/MRDRNA2_29748_c0_seq2:114-713(-)
MAALLLLISLVPSVGAISSGQYPPWRGNEKTAASMLPASMLQADVAAEAAVDQELENLDSLSKVSVENMEMQNRLKSTIEANEEGVLAKKQDTDDVNPTMIAIVTGVVVLFIVVLALIAKSRGEGYKAFGDKSGLSTSSSDITSSETGSTDRELKSRMERFEKRLEEHKKMLESKGDESSSVTDSDSKVSSSNGYWMKK